MPPLALPLTLAFLQQVHAAAVGVCAGGMSSRARSYPAGRCLVALVAPTAQAARRPSAALLGGLLLSTCAPVVPPFLSRTRLGSLAGHLDQLPPSRHAPSARACWMPPLGLPLAWSRCVFPCVRVPPWHTPSLCATCACMSCVGTLPLRVPLCACLPHAPSACARCRRAPLHAPSACLPARAAPARSIRMCPLPARPPASSRWVFPCPPACRPARNAPFACAPAGLCVPDYCTPHVLAVC